MIFTIYNYDTNPLIVQGQTIQASDGETPQTFSIEGIGGAAVPYAKDPNLFVAVVNQTAQIGFANKQFAGDLALNIMAKMGLGLISLN